MARANASLSLHNPTIYIATGAACWAGYLIKGDASGLSNEERELADAWPTSMGRTLLRSAVP
jgi:hypothetical protein